MAMAGLVVLLFAMGASIGADEQLLQNLGTMGLQAGALAGSATLCSVVAGWGWERFAGRTQEAGGKKQEANQQISKAANHKSQITNRKSARGRRQISKSQIANRKSARVARPLG